MPDLIENPDAVPDVTVAPLVAPPQVAGPGLFSRALGMLPLLGSLRGTGTWNMSENFVRNLLSVLVIEGTLLLYYVARSHSPDGSNTTPWVPEQLEMALGATWGFYMALAENGGMKAFHVMCLVGFAMACWGVWQWAPPLVAGFAVQAITQYFARRQAEGASGGAV